MASSSALSRAWCVGPALVLWAWCAGWGQDLASELDHLPTGMSPHPIDFHGETPQREE